MTPDPALPSNATPFRVVFGRDARTQVDTISLSLDGSEFRGGLDSFVAGKHRAIAEVKAVLEKRRTNNKPRSALNTHIGCGSPWRAQTPEVDGVGGERKPYHLRPADLRHEFKVEFKHAFSGPVFRLAEEASTPAPRVRFVAKQLGGRVTHGPGNTEAASRY